MKQKVVRARITETVADCIVYSEDVGIGTQVICIPSTFKTFPSLEKAIREHLAEDGLSLVEIKSFKKQYGIFEMPIEKFIAEADYSYEPMTE